MENDECLSDADLIYVGEEHIDLDDPSMQSAGADGEYLIDQDQEQGGGYAEVDDCDYVEGVYVDSKNEDDMVDLKEEKEGAGGEVDGLMVVDELDDEDFNSEDESEAVEKDALNPEEVERAILTMPTMKVLMDDIGHLKKNRSVIVSPLSVDDFNASQIQDILTWNTLEEVKMNYTRNHKDVKTIVGIMVLHFTTSGSATRAVEHLKLWRENLNIKVESNSNKIVEDFVSDTRGKKRWTDSIALLRNLADDVKVENIKELFPQVEEVVLHLETSKRRESSTANKDASSTGPAAVPATTPITASTPRGYAYLIFPSDDVMKAEIEEAENKKIELNGHRIYMLHYRNPIQPIHRHYLRLRERKVIMKHMDKCERGIEQAKTDASVKLPEKVQERVDLCKLLIEKDNKSRKEMELPEPSLEDLKKMSGLPTLDSGACQNILVRFGIIKERKKRSSPHNDRDKKRNRSPYKPLSHRGPGRRNSPMRGSRRSPYSNRKRGRGNYRNSRNMGGRAAQASLLGTAAGIVNPLALMMQQNLGMLGGAGVLNPNLLVQPNLAMMGPGTNLLGSQGLSYIGGGGSLEEAKSSMLRLDETGNFRQSENSRQQSSRYDDRMRRGGEDGRRKRSRSPMDRGPIGMRSRSGYDVPSSASRTSMEDEVSGPVNLLLNLSQMLSQKMEQKRQQIDDKRGSYDRDFRGSQR